MTSAPTLTMNDGNPIPQIGFGIWQVPQDEAAAAVASAIGQGYRLIDGAYIYGNEVGLGEGLRRSGLPRDEVFVTTKVWNADHGRDRTREAVARSLSNIGVEQLDLVLIHWPVPSQDLYVETWQTLVELRDAGQIRSIGVSNFNADHLERIIAATGVVPAVNQIEVNPELQQPEMRATNAAHGILTQSWTPLGKGRSFEKDPITAAAARTGKSAAQVVLRWNLQLGNLVIARSVKPARQLENLDILDFELSDDEMAAIATLDMGMRSGPDPSVFKLL